MKCGGASQTGSDVTFESAGQLPVFQFLSTVPATTRRVAGRTGRATKRTLPLRGPRGSDVYLLALGPLLFPCAKKAAPCRPRLFRRSGGAAPRTRHRNGRGARARRRSDCWFGGNYDGGVCPRAAWRKFACMGQMLRILCFVGLLLPSKTRSVDQGRTTALTAVRSALRATCGRGRRFNERDFCPVFGPVFTRGGAVLSPVRVPKTWNYPMNRLLDGRSPFPPANSSRPV
jgi:hypothetical protein